MSGYDHGTSGEIGSSVVGTTSEALMAPLYVGTAPVNLIRGYKDAGIINVPVKLTNGTCKTVIGYSDDWKAFTLSEVVDAHFNNSKGNIAPVYVINVLDPDKHKKDEKTTLQVTFSSGRAIIESDTIIVDTFAMEDKAEGTDYTLTYNFGLNQLVIESADKNARLEGTIAASFYEVDTSAVLESDIIGEESEDGVYTGLQVGKLIYPKTGDITYLVGAPGWSEKPAVYEALVEYVQGINDHWYAFVMADIPVKDKEGAVDTIAKAIEWQSNNAYTSMFSKILWPQCKVKGNKIYHLSTLAMAEQIRTDNTHDGVPMETCSNKAVPVIAQYFGEDSKNQGFDQSTGNKLNEKGISTVVGYAGAYYLWGPHTAGFEAGEGGNAKADVDPLAIFDVNIRMQSYVLNSFQSDWGETIDTPMTVALRDTILNAEREKLGTLTAMGALKGEPTVEFLESENTEDNIVNGNFVFNFADTPTPPAKSLKAIVSYTDKGFSSFWGEEE